jgi:glycosyltransferase involved in cell wall biosynthesis
LIRLAFTLIGGRNWTGGYNYLLNLVRALATHQPDALRPVMFFGEDTAADDAAPFAAIPGVEVVRTPVFDATRKTGALARSLLLGRDAATQAEFARHGIAAVFEAAQFHGWRGVPPAIAWIPDFQHRYLPHLFGRVGYWRRELGFRGQVLAGRQIMLSSEDSRQACERFYPSTAGRTHVVHFAVPRPPAVDAATARAVADRYGLPAHYVFMPNQFWQHKNHALVLDALALLRERGRSDIVIAASGKPSDPRKPGHYPALEARVAALGLGSQLRLLGLLPYADLAPLLRASDALLNPSLFEGWSTTVEEARAVGVPMILSDLDVHREQAGAQARFFDRFDAASLADALVAPLPAACTDEAALEREAGQRMADFAQAFVALVEATVRGAPARGPRP